MPSLLLFNYYFPPSGGPAVQRWVSLVEWLAQWGWTIHVVSPDPAVATYPSLDEVLARRVPTSVKIWRTDTSELFWVYKKWIGGGKVPGTVMADDAGDTWPKKAARFVRGNLLLPDPRRGWNAHAIAKGLELIAHERIDIIVTAGPPHSTHLIGLALQRKCKIPWIADLHDYWTNAMYIKPFYRTWPAQQIDRLYEREVLRKATAVLTHCQSSRAFFGRIRGRTVDIEVLTMGYDESLFEGENPTQQAFEVAYVGTMAGFYAVESVLDALVLLHRDRPDIPLRLCMVGVATPFVAQYLQARQAGHLLETTGYLSHAKAVRRMRQASVLWLVNPPTDNQAIHVPGKLYEYLAARKPVLNLAPADSEPAQLLEACAAGRTFERHQTTQMRDWLEHLADEWLRHHSNDLPDTGAYRQYARREEAHKLDRFLRQRLEKSNH